MANIDIKLAVWKSKLLDLSKRNRLLNYRDSKSSNLRLSKPAIFDLWENFVVNEKPLHFPYFDEEKSNVTNEDVKNYSEGDVVTNQTQKDQQKTLRNLRNKAKIAMEEQGVNILYLSFGFLKWREDKNSDQDLLSPVILVPVSLTVESIVSPFVLSLHEDEITLNPTLVYKMSNDFGIELPEFDPNESLSDYFKKITSLISVNKWEVVAETGLSLLSFLKINMYRDLDIHKDKICANSVVQALTGDAKASEQSLEEFIDYDHDAKTVPFDLFQVVDADSSQQDAILLAKNGVSFVLQGPPGTGKSQTITNIIAECLAAGKKVLFVSEKMAALEVVRRRLTAAGLNEFCMALHSHKANKKEVLEQLANSLSLSRQKANLSDDAFQKLDQLQETKEKLNDYTKQIHTAVKPLGKTIYQINGYLANLESFDNVIFDIQNSAQTSGQEFNRYINLLIQFRDTIGKMTDDLKNNPWFNSNIEALPLELNHNIKAYLSKLLPKIKIISDISDRITADLQTDLSSSYNGLFEISEILALAEKSPDIPADLIFDRDLYKLYSEAEKFSEITCRYKSNQSELKVIYNELVGNDPEIILCDPLNLLSSVQINAETKKIDDFIAKKNCYSVWNTEGLKKAEHFYETLKKESEAVNSIKNKINSEYEREIFDVDHRGMISRFKAEYTSFLKYFKAQYRKDKRTIQGLSKQFLKKISDREVIDVLTSLRELEESKKWISENNQTLEHLFGEHYKGEKSDLKLLSKLIKAFAGLVQIKEKLSELVSLSSVFEKNHNDLSLHLGSLYKGLETDWEEVTKSLAWVKEFKTVCSEYRISPAFIKNVINSDSKKSLCLSYSTELNVALQNIEPEFVWFSDLFENTENFKIAGMPLLYERFNKCLNGLSLLEEWIDYRNVRSLCQKVGLGDYIKKVEEIRIDTSLIIPIFKKRFYRLWLDAVLPQYPAVLNFRQRNHNHTIEDFSLLDKIQFDIAKARVKKQLIDSLPSLDRLVSGVDEIAILKRELTKQRKIKPIRKLFKEIPNLLLTLKPCLMMSPLSVSLFLEAESYDFDIVIFDEASQVCTENAIGAISRGRQVVITGDSKQLPPTNFFTSAVSDADYDTDDEDDNYDDTNAYESVLDEAQFLPERTLSWHYRSRHEHLIAFSNAKIYKNNLITFPANVDRVPNKGVEYIYVADGFYDRGGKKGNVIEAKRIGELVFEHFLNFPGRSLGVVAFGEVQQQAIDTVIRHMRKENQQFESFFNEDNEEAFFVKNLENVQGDERDTIIFSIGYAKDSNGKFTMNFGPLSKFGGERRLNVAITRAKHNVKLVGSIIPTDINIDHINSDGPKMLRSYIDFAINGMSVLQRETTESSYAEHDSPFEEAVYKLLDRKGYKIATQVGCSGYRIDMAVKHPTISGQYVIGIECDGAAYHSARTARERDRLRQDVLENMGWKIYRIWSTDWIKDPSTEGGKLIAAIDDAIKDYSEDDCNQVPPSSTQQVEKEFLSIDEKEAIPTTNGNNKPEGFEKSKPISFDELPRDNYGLLDLKDCIKKIVDEQYPIHYELLCKILVPLFGYEKNSKNVKNKVEYALQTIHTIKRKGDFLFPINYTKITPKTIGDTREIQHISTDELAEAMLILVQNSFGILKDSLLQTTAREYGFARTSERIQTSMQEAYELLLESGRAKEVEGKVLAV